MQWEQVCVTSRARCATADSRGFPDIWSLGRGNQHGNPRLRRGNPISFCESANPNVDEWVAVPVQAWQSGYVTAVIRPNLLIKRSSKCIETGTCTEHWLGLLDSAPSSPHCILMTLDIRSRITPIFKELRCRFSLSRRPGVHFICIMYSPFSLLASW